MEITIKQILREYRLELKKIDNTKSRFRKRFSKSLKSKVVQLVNQGEKRTVIHDALKISSPTLRVWIKQFSKPAQFESFKELKISKANNISQNSRGFTIISPSGFVINVGSQQELVSVIRQIETLS